MLFFLQIQRNASVTLACMKRLVRMVSVRTVARAYKVIRASTVRQVLFSILNRMTPLNAHKTQLNNPNVQSADFKND